MKTDMEIFLKKHQAATTESHAIVVRSLEEVNRLHETVENLLTLARSKKSDVLMEFEEVSITKPIHVTIKKLQHLADAKHLSLIVTKHADALVLGNERLLEQLFFNLIQNAITYTNEGEISIDISAAKQVIVRIQDTGIGIDKDSITHVFEPFYKVDASHSTNAGGVGLGLAIVKEIVSKHNGSINVQSQPGKGTVVIVTLPRYLPDVS
jgi:two-component system phosphate regulon sensor histidine kinase PhoR